MKEKKRLHPVIHFYSYVGTPELVFFLSLILMLILPVFSLNNYSLISTIFNTFLLGSLYYLAKSHRPKQIKLIGFVIMVALIDSWTSFIGIKLNNAFDFIIPLVLLALSFYFVAKSILKTREADVDTIISAISGYILIGMGFGILFYMGDIIKPGNFFDGKEISYYEAKYFAFVTVSTLGYGDISPLSHAAKSLAIIATLFGQFYMVIIMGIIVGKFVSPNKEN